MREHRAEGTETNLGWEKKFMREHRTIREHQPDPGWGTVDKG